VLRINLAKVLCHPLKAASLKDAWQLPTFSKGEKIFHALQKKHNFRNMPLYSTFGLSGESFSQQVK